MGEGSCSQSKNYAIKAEIPLHLARLRLVLDVPALVHDQDAAACPNGPRRQALCRA